MNSANPGVQRQRTFLGVPRWWWMDQTTNVNCLICWHLKHTVKEMGDIVYSRHTMISNTCTFNNTFNCCRRYTCQYLLYLYAKSCVRTLWNMFYLIRLTISIFNLCDSRQIADCPNAAPPLTFVAQLTPALLTQLPASNERKYVCSWKFDLFRELNIIIALQF